MAVTVYSSSDTGAPVLTAQVGTLLAVLRACLVTGYGSKPPAGWSEPFTASANIGVFRQGPKTGRQQFYLRVQDNVGNRAFLSLWESMTSLNGGTNGVPVTGQPVPTAWKSAAWGGDATPRPWMMVADHRTFYLWVVPHSDGRRVLSCWAGDIYSLVESDQYGVAVAGLMDRDPPEASDAWHLRSLTLSTTINRSDNTIVYLARDQSWLAVSQQVGLHANPAQLLNEAPGGPNLRQGTNPADGKIWVSPIWVHEAPTMSIRGRLRGLLAPSVAAGALSDLSEIPGSGPTAGRTYMWVRFNTAARMDYMVLQLGALLVEISDTWESD